MTLNALRSEYYESLNTIMDEPDDKFEYDNHLSFVDVITSGSKYLPAIAAVHTGLIAGGAATTIAGITPLGAAAAGASGISALAGAAILGLKALNLLQEAPKRAKVKPPKKQIAEDYSTPFLALVDAEKKRSFPGQAFLEKISPSKAKRFKQRGQHEARMSKEDDYQDLLRNQLASWEQLLRDTFLNSPDPLIDSILSKSKKDERIILEEHFKANNKHSVFILELWTRSLRRLIIDKDPKICAWVQSNFSSSVKRHVDEQHPSLQTLGRKKNNLPLFVAQLRKIRNPMMHGDTEVSFQRYQEWCDFAYGTSSLLQWLDVGVSPQIHKANHFGWLSFIVTACAQKQ